MVGANIKSLFSFSEISEPIEAKNLSIDQYVRLTTRSLLTASSFDAAMVSYSRHYFDQIGNTDLHFRHDVVSKLRGTLAFSVLWAIYLNSASFENFFKSETGTTPPKISGTNSEASPSLYANLVREMLTQTELENDQPASKQALTQRVRKIARSAKEVELVDYVFVKTNKTLIHGTEALHDFFTNWLSSEFEPPERAVALNDSSDRVKSIGSKKPENAQTLGKLRSKTSSDKNSERNYSIQFSDFVAEVGDLFKNRKSTWDSKSKVVNRNITEAKKILGL